MRSMAQYREACQAFFGTLWPAEEKVLVFGEGQAERPPVMLIGEAPGEQETLQRRPFVGKAGKNLDGFLAAVGLERPDIYISNVVKVRPVRVSAKGTVSNRAPSREELLLFTPWLYEEILMVRPRCIVTLGNTALKAVLSQEAVIGGVHGQVQTAQVAFDGQTETFPLFPLYHPASIIYNRALKETYDDDLRRLRAYLDEA